LYRLRFYKHLIVVTRLVWQWPAEISAILTKPQTSSGEFTQAGQDISARIEAISPEFACVHFLPTSEQMTQFFNFLAPTRA
jgi:hypothetical protein